jgi:hypothetical protein
LSFSFFFVFLALLAALLKYQPAQYTNSQLGRSSLSYQLSLLLFQVLFGLVEILQRDQTDCRFFQSLVKIFCHTDKSIHRTILGSILDAIS